jgi:hypothetical protein
MGRKRMRRAPADLTPSQPISSSPSLIGIPQELLDKIVEFSLPPKPCPLGLRVTEEWRDVSELGFADQHAEGTEDFGPTVTTNRFKRMVQLSFVCEKFRDTLREIIYRDLYLTNGPVIERLETSQRAVGTDEIINLLRRTLLENPVLQAKCQRFAVESFFYKFNPTYVKELGCLLLETREFSGFRMMDNRSRDSERLRERSREIMDAFFAIVSSMPKLQTLEFGGAFSLLAIESLLLDLNDLKCLMIHLQPEEVEAGCGISLATLLKVCISFPFLSGRGYRGHLFSFFCPAASDSYWRQYISVTSKLDVSLPETSMSCPHFDSTPKDHEGPDLQ